MQRFHSCTKLSKMDTTDDAYTGFDATNIRKLEFCRPGIANAVFRYLTVHDSQ